MFHIGDKIVYPNHGAGVIVDVEKKEILGETREYYILKMPINDMQVMVPVGSMREVGVRGIKSKEDMDNVLQVLKNPERKEMPGNWNRRFRYHQEVIKEGDLGEIAEVIKNLEYLDLQKSLSTGERKMLNNARQIVLSEMVLVYQEPLEKIKDLVDSAMRDSGIFAKGEDI